MVKLRLQRFGSNKKPFYRVVASESSTPRDGKFIEVVGNYNPGTNPATVTIDETKVLNWLVKGAQPTETVRSLLSKKGIMTKFNELKKTTKTVNQTK